MKKITSKKLQSALLRGAVAVAGCMATFFVALFCNSIYGVVVTIFLGATAVVLVSDAVK